MKPFDIDAAWQGNELFSRPEWQFKLSADETDELLTAAKRLKVNASCTAAAPDSLALPLLEAKLERIQDLLENGTGVVRLQGFPADARLTTNNGRNGPEWLPTQASLRFVRSRLRACGLGRSIQGMMISIRSADIRS